MKHVSCKQKICFLELLHCAFAAARCAAMHKASHKHLRWPWIPLICLGICPHLIDKGHISPREGWHPWGTLGWTFSPESFILRQHATTVLHGAISGAVTPDPRQSGRAAGFGEPTFPWAPTNVARNHCNVDSTGVTNPLTPSYAHPFTTCFDLFWCLMCTGVQKAKLSDSFLALQPGIPPVAPEDPTQFETLRSLRLSAIGQCAAEPRDFFLNLPCRL